MYLHLQHFFASISFFDRLVPESPRWLVLNGKEEEAKTVLGKISRMNKRPLPDDIALQKSVIPETRASFRQMFSSWETAKKTLICWDLWYGYSVFFLFSFAWCKTLLDHLYMQTELFPYNSLL
jgi:hypothetical protein